MGMINQAKNYHTICLIEFSTSKSTEIPDDMQALISKTGVNEKILEATVMVMTDKCPAQVLANQKFIEKINGEFENNIIQLSCFMHSTSNMEKNLCQNQ